MLFLKVDPRGDRSLDTYRPKYTFERREEIVLAGRDIDEFGVSDWARLSHRADDARDSRPCAEADAGSRGVEDQRQVVAALSIGEDAP
jgi:hypothetical protein